MWFIITLALAYAVSAVVLDSAHNHYILHHDPTHASLADVANHLGLRIVDRVGVLEDMWLAQSDTETLSLDARDTKADPVIESYWAMRRQASISRRSESMSLAVKHISRQIPRMVTQNGPPFAKRVRPPPLRADPYTVAQRLGIKDPAFPEQWSLIDPDYSVNVPRVWDQYGYTGKGVLVAVIDDGLKYDHKDLIRNFDADHSYDFVGGVTQLPVPSAPFYHGTAVAGVIAAAKNELCGVGIAYESKVAGLRVKGPLGMYDMHEAAALNYDAQEVDIYSSAHGMGNFESPPYVTKQAYLYGVTYGRNRKGSIYVTASGNEDARDSNCNYNGWVNSIYTITLGAVDKNGRHVTDSSPCTAVMAAAYSSNAEYTSRIFSLNIGTDESCDDYFGGTSAAAAAASGIFALALEANPNLTWRDIEYLVVETSKFIGNDWTAVAGRKYNEKLGFGVLDALALVTAAKDWRTVPARTWIESNIYQFAEGTMDHNGKFSGGDRLNKRGVSTPVVVTEEMAEKQNFGKIEKVEVKVWVRHQKRGDVEVTLVSPSGRKSRLATRRREDRAKTGLRGWTFMSVKHWGESPVGEWTLKVNDQKERHISKATGRIIGFSMIFWGCAHERGWDSIYEMPADDYGVFPPPGRSTFGVESDGEPEEEGITADYTFDSD